MKKAYTLSIDQPCGEDWNKMTKTENGRFCDVCSKTVFDFTKLSDDELIKMFKRNKSLPCGRYTSRQINRPLISTQQPKGKALFSRLLSGLFLLVAGEQAIAKEAPTKTEIVSPRDIQEEAESKQQPKQIVPKDTLQDWVQGRVFDLADKYEMPGVSIWIKGTNSGTITDLNGQFKLKISEYFISDTITLVVSFVGYESKTITVSNTDQAKFLEIWLKVKPVSLDDIIVTMGYGDFRKKDLSAPVVLISAENNKKPTTKQKTFGEKIKSVFSKKGDAKLK